MRSPFALAALALGLAALAGCSSEPAVFDNAGGQPVTCLPHQDGEPGPDYTDPAERDTGRVLALMRFHTEHGNLPYCDGEPAGDSDRAWAQVFVDLGGSADNAASALGRK